MAPSIEKTPIGLQYAIPGAELVVKPRRRAFKADGDLPPCHPSASGTTFSEH